MKDMLNTCSRFCLNRSLGLLLIRCAVGIVFFAHGWGKIHGIGMVEGMMTGFGFPYGTGFFLAWLETLGGLALILGVLPRIVGTIFGIEMLIATLLTGFGRGLYRPHELEIFLMLVSFGIALAGSGRYALLKMECDDCGGMMCKGEKGLCPAN